MRILLVSDIHANWPALAAINEPHDVCICLGDLVDYGPDPARCVRWTMESAHDAIRGNHDHGVAQGIPVSGENGFRYLTRVSRPFLWDALGHDERRYLLPLPLTQRLTLKKGKRFLLVHATPRDPLDEYLMIDPATRAKRIQRADADIVCVGHSHLQLNREVEGVGVVNPGSVGQPRDGGPRAAHDVITDHKIELERVEYPVEKTIARIGALPWPERAKPMMTLGLRNGRLPESARADEDSE